MRRRRGGLGILTLAGVTTMACASAGRPALLGPPREQPASLVGRWTRERTDPSRASDRTIRLLVLRADGQEWTESPTDATDSATVRDVPRAWWWVYRGEGGEPARLCLHWRAGRHRADCDAFQLDTVQRDGRALHRIRWGDETWIATP